MENIPQNQPKSSNQALWIILILVILALAGYGIYAYVSSNTNNANNANSTTNTNQVTNTNTSINTNSTANTNSAANSNANTNTATNTNIDTSGWKTYINSEFGFEIRHPVDWQTDVNQTQYGNTIGTTISFNIPKTQENPTDSNIQVFLNISVFDQVNQENIDEAFNRIFKVDLSNSKVSDYTVNGKIAKYYSNVPGFESYDSVFANNDSKWFEIRKGEISKVTFEEIIQTFKFE